MFSFLLFDFSIYHDAGAVLKKLDEHKGSIKSIVFSLPYTLSRKKALYALTTKTLQCKLLMHGDFMMH